MMPKLNVNEARHTTDQIVLFKASHSRWPCPTSQDADERALGAWLDHRRRSHRAGTMSADVAAFLDAALPGWPVTAFPTAGSRATLADVIAYFHDFGRWPACTRCTAHERMGTWMQSRRREARLGTIDPTTAAELDEVDRHWRGGGCSGRPRAGRPEPLLASA